MRNHFQRHFKCQQISRVRRTITDPTDQTFQVVYRIQVFPDLLAKHRLHVQFRYRIQSFVDRICIDQWLFHKASQHTGTHGSFCLIQHPQKGAAFLFFPQGLHQFQISSRRTVDNHIAVCSIRDNFIHMLHGIFLGIQKIPEQGTGCDHTAVIISQSQPLKRGNLKMLQ